MTNSQRENDQTNIPESVAERVDDQTITTEIVPPHAKNQKINMSAIATKLHQSAEKYRKDFKANPASWKKVDVDPFLGITILETKFEDRNIQIRIDTQTNIETIIITGSEEDKKAGLMGTDGTAVIKFLGDDSYDNIKTEDHLDKGRLLFDATRDIIKTLIIKNDRNNEKKTKLLAWLEEEEQKYYQAIKTTYRIDPTKMRSEKANEYFTNIHKEVKHLQQQCLVNIAHSLDFVYENKDKNIKKRFKEIKQAEKIHILKQGRPTILKIKKLGAKNFVSMQTPLGKETIPSSLRGAWESRTVKLANHVRDGSGVIEGDKIRIDHVVDSHSSYPPIKEKNELVRRKIAIDAVHEKVTELVKDIKDKSPNKDISISLSTMMLLTPWISKFIDETLRRDQSERNQMADTRFALEYLNHTKPITVTIDNVKYNVNVDVTCMNLPVNVGEKEQKILTDELQRNLNHTGFNKYCDNIQRHIDSYIRNQKQTLEKTLSAELKADLKKMRDYTLENSSLITAQVSLNADRAKKEVKLIKLYENLNKYLTKYNKARQLNVDKVPGSKVDMKINKLKYYTIKNKINRIQTNIDKKSNRINKIKKSIYNENKETIATCQKNIIQELKSNNDLDGETRKYLQLELRFSQAQDMFLNDGYKQKQNLYKMQLLFLLTNETIGQHIEAFCKSAEDRTGWLRVLLLAHMAFNEIHQRDPDLTGDTAEFDKREFDELVADAYELSASLENTKYNSFGRGLQVKPSLTDQIAYFGYLNSRLPKEMYGDTVLSRLKKENIELIKPNNVFSDAYQMKTKQTDQRKDIPTTTILPPPVPRTAIENPQKPPLSTKPLPQIPPSDKRSKKLLPTPPVRKMRHPASPLHESTSVIFGQIPPGEHDAKRLTRESGSSPSEGIKQDKMRQDEIINSNEKENKTAPTPKAPQTKRNTF